MSFGLISLSLAMIACLAFFIRGSYNQNLDGPRLNIPYSIGCLILILALFYPGGATFTTWAGGVMIVVLASAMFLNDRSETGPLAVLGDLKQSLDSTYDDIDGQARVLMEAMTDRKIQRDREKKKK